MKPHRSRVTVPAVGGWEAREKTLPAPTGGSRVAPWLTGDCEKRYEGRDARKPWDYPVTAVIPHLETPDLLPAVIGLLRAQTAAPYILVIDTGSGAETCRYLETEIRAADVEVHYVRGHGYRHPSEPVALAQDLAMVRCLTPHLYCTHADVFLRRREFVAELLALCTPERPVVGYEMSPRDGSDGKVGWLTDDARGMAGHTATMLHVPTLRRLGITWTMERAYTEFGVGRSRPGWPDTEATLGYGLRQAGLEPLLIGHETNHERYDDDNLTHCRSYPCSQLYGQPYHQEARRWIEAALAEAAERLQGWGAG